ncbi:Mitochondrial distribution and morphology protein 12 [Zalaria obscura]|uniref:Mitochondrial distribution and morphology protein 12 n=1 Tax=Zalaria obscura TaxID=2024903 RepID=A0ACC3S4F2_9PEZI
MPRRIEVLSSPSLGQDNGKNVAQLATIQDAEDGAGEKDSRSENMARRSQHLQPSGSDITPMRNTPLDSEDESDGPLELPVERTGVAGSINTSLKGSSAGTASRNQTHNQHLRTLSTETGKGKDSAISNTPSPLPSPRTLPVNQPDRPGYDYPRVSQSHLPSFKVSRASSSDALSLRSSANTDATKQPLEPSANLNAGLQQSRAPTKHSENGGKGRAVIPASLKRRVISKEFWMKDENARDCFYCGGAFSTFRRKHHCRTCGQIFDAKCTSLVPGQPFGQPGTLRLCKPCEAMIYGSDDDSSVFSDEEESLSPGKDHLRASPSLKGQLDGAAQFRPEDATLATPSIGIPVSRRNREAKRRSAVIEFDAPPVLARPSSSRSLKSLTGRPRSSSHKRHHSRHQHMRTGRHFSDDRGPFYQNALDSERRLPPLPAFHNDNIIDPDLAPFLSDEGSDDDQSNIFASLNSDMHSNSPAESERAGFASLLASAVKKGRSRLGDRSVGTPSITGGRDADNVSLSGKHTPRLARRRNPSIGSLMNVRPSPRRSRSHHILKNLDESSMPDMASMSPLVFENLNTSSEAESRIKRSSAMHGAAAPVVELNRASLQHVRRLLSQLLRDGKIPHRSSWEKALLPILLQCTDDVDPDVQRGDDMDIRNYIKLKKIPGGRPGDTAYVSGIVFSKNIALKSMKRSFRQPRVVIVTFAIEYARHNQHFMSLEPVIAQEREYLRSLVGRIAALRPHVLLVQRNVSGLALQMLQEAGITVVYNIKQSVLAAVARVTQTAMIKSVDKLSIDPANLGRCESFDVKTFMHDRVRKTYIYMSGCQADLGCTIVLRGAETETLRQVKRITEFMCYVVYNLKLETCLMRDEFVLIPSTPNEGVAAPHCDPSKARKPIENIDSLPASEAVKRIADVVTTSDTTGEDKVISDNPEDHSRQDQETIKAPEEPAEQQPMDSEQPEDTSIPSEYRELVETARTRIISSSPFVQYSEPHLLTQAYESERRVEHFKKLRDRYAATNDEAADEKDEEAEQFELVQPDMIKQAIPAQQSRTVRDFLHAVHDAQYEKALQTYDIQRRQWKQFYAGSNENPFDPFSHQNIIVLHSVVSSVTSAPCAGPELMQLGFYAGYGHADTGFEEDCTIGQFIEDICIGSSNSCKVCNRKMHDHHRSYVHGSGQLSISVKRYPAKMHGLRSTILMWSTCKICGQETTVIPMSESTWKYSLGKYLELSFWSTPLKPRASLCPHDVHKDFVRCFGFQDLAVRVQYDNIDIYDVIVPGTSITWEVSADLTLKNQQFSHFRTRLAAFTASIKARLDSINLSTVVPEKVADATAAVEKMVMRAENDHQEMLKKLQDKYTSSRFYELVPLNRAVRLMDEKALSWDEAFSEFERNFFPSENDIRRLATLQLKKLFLDSKEAGDGNASDTEDGVEMQERPRPKELELTDEQLHSEKAQNMLSAVVEEEHGNSVPEAENSENPPAVPDSLEAPLGPSLSRQVSPGEHQSQTVQREHVKHLDLAVPKLTPEPSSDGEPSEHAETSQETTRPGTSDSQTAPEPFATDPKPLTSSILERIEQIRSSSAAATNTTSPDPQPTESRIPRLTNLRKGTNGSSTPPALNRAQSQPGHIPSRSADMSVDMPSIETVASGDPSDDEARATSGTGKEPTKTLEQRLADRLAPGYFKSGKPAGSLIPRSIPSKQDNTTRVSALAKHFEQLSREFERERLRERRLRAARSRQNRANPLASSRPVVEVYKDAREAVGEKNDELRIDVDKTSSDASQGQDQTSDATIDVREADGHLSETSEATDQYTDTEMGGSTLGQTASDTDGDGETTDTEQVLSDTNRQRDKSDPLSGISSTTLLSPSSPHDMEVHLDLSLPKHEKSTLMKMLTSFWSERSASGWLPLEYPLLPTEHVFDDSDIIVREDEPSSVIALALSSSDYMMKQNGFREKRRGRTNAHAHTASQVSNFSTQTHQASVQEAIEASLVGDVGTHMRYSFTHGQVKAQCKIFYAESFDALRRKCGVSERFVESLSRCAKWDSKGGKTKSLFLKTLDDRFVIKSLQEVELKAFTKFAPDYFAFMSHTLFHGVPSVIAKMFGLFQVVIKNPATGVEFSYYLLVMENLFYDRKPTRRFDLKGSMRNRKIESTGQPDEVLLDENLVETIFETPLFVREHNRKLLRASVWNDTMWLCKQNVMDYSLMAGFDDEAKQLIVGIIDCIRTYTWDKKLESWIKDRGKNKPTITSPKDYRNRFRVSMMQYVLQAPNVWHQFSSQIPPPTTLKQAEEREERQERQERQEDRTADGADASLGVEATIREMNSVLI